MRLNASQQGERRESTYRGDRFGLGLRRPHFAEIFQRHDGVDFLEIVSENFMDFGGRPRAVLQRAVEHFPVVPHGVGLSIGGPDPLDAAYLASLRRLLDQLQPPWFSDHLCYSSAFGVHYHDLIPLPFSQEAVRHVAARADEAQHRMGVPLLLENPSYYVTMPGAEMTEAEFITEVLQRADCGLLLDINNVYVNSRNHGYDPCAFIDALPLERVRQIHMAGHDASGPFLVDTHGAPAIDAVLHLFQYALQRVGPVWTCVEWDNDIPSLDQLLAENARVRAAATEVVQRSKPLRVSAMPSLFSLPSMSSMSSSASCKREADSERERKPDPERKLECKSEWEWEPEANPAAQQDTGGGLRSTLQRMHTLLRGDADVATLAQVFAASRERLAIYPRFVRSHVATALEKNFTVLVELLPAVDWQRIVDAFFAEHPPQAYELNACVAKFPAFVEALARQNKWGLQPYHAELAELEWHEWQVYSSCEELPDPAQLTTPVLNPTLAILQFQHTVGHFVARWRRWKHWEQQRHQQLIQEHCRKAEAGEVVFVYRHPESLLHAFCCADDALLFAFKVVHDGLAWEDAAQAAGIPVQRVAELIDAAVAAGVVIAPSRSVQARGYQEDINKKKVTQTSACNLQG